SWHVRAEDGIDLIGEGTHDRVVVIWERFNAKITEKAARAAAPR
ncbi:MAG: thioesterase, partial [Rhodospirillaceae bacterium BRH_c57]